MTDAAQPPGGSSPGPRVAAHASPTRQLDLNTTEIYLRRLDKERAMESVRDLSWGSPFGAFMREAPSGIEPLYEALQASA